MKKGFLNALALLLIFLLLGAMAGCEGDTANTPETEEPVLLQAEGTLVSYEKGELTLQTEDGALSFLTDAETSFSLARGFIAGDVFVVSYEEGDEAARLVSSTANDALEPYTLRGTVRAVSGAEMTLALEEGGKASFSIAAAELDLWQGLREGIYVELCCLGDATGGSCVWVQRVADNDGEAYLTPAEPAATDKTESGETVGEETSEETSEEDTRDWPYEPCEDTVWPSVRANLRLGPGMNYPCVGEVECGEELTRCGVSDEWSAVVIDGREYYVATELLLTERPGKLSTIEYDANGGMAAPETQHKLGGEQLVLSQLVPVRKGWHFLHWNTHEKGYGMIFEPGAVYAIDGDITLYAQWEEGEPELPVEEPDVSEEMTDESTEEMTEETTEETAEPVRDSSSAIAGTLISMEDGRLCLQAAGLEYEFDVSAATLTAESGVHPGDLVTVRYAGTLGAERDSTAAPAVRVMVTTGEPEESGKLTAVGADLAAISTGKTELFAAVDALDADMGESVTLCLSSADGNLFTATVK